MAALVSALLLSLYVFASQAGPPPSSRPPVQFVLGDSALKKHATVAGNELTITAGAKKPYLSLATVTDFEIVGEIRLDGDADAALLLYAWEPEIASEPVFPLRLASSPHAGELSGPGVRASSDAKVGASFVAAARDWQPIRISCMGRHVRVVVSGGLLTEGDLPSPQFGRIGIEVKKGSISLRNWQFVRWDGPATRPLLDDNPGVIDAEVKTPPAGFTIPKLQHEVHPRYTGNAMRRKVWGDAELEAIVERTGYVGPIRVTKSLDHELDIEAIRAARQWRFAPALMRGEPVRCRVQITMSFTLK
jgi:TonB family protein